jgi:hypothetical protein
MGDDPRPDRAGEQPDASQHQPQTRCRHGLRQDIAEIDRSQQPGQMQQAEQDRGHHDRPARPVEPQHRDNQPAKHTFLAEADGDTNREPAAEPPRIGLGTALHGRNRRDQPERPEQADPIRPQAAGEAAAPPEVLSRQHQRQNGSEAELVDRDESEFRQPRIQHQGDAGHDQLPAQHGTAGQQQGESRPNCHDVYALPIATCPPCMTARASVRKFRVALGRPIFL